MPPYVLLHVLLFRHRESVRWGEAIVRSPLPPSVTAEPSPFRRRGANGGETRWFGSNECRGLASPVWQELGDSAVLAQRATCSEFFFRWSTQVGSKILLSNHTWTTMDQLSFCAFHTLEVESLCVTLVRKDRSSGFRFLRPENTMRDPVRK